MNEPTFTPVLDVTHPPPAALPEIVPDQPAKDAVWVDGYWAYEDDSWVWRRGGWVKPSEGIRLEPSRFWYDDQGIMHFSDRKWTNRSGAAVGAPPVVLPAATPRTPSLPEEATLP